MEKIYDVTALGELLIDFTENGTSAQGNPLLEANPGGAPCNVLAMLEKLGKKTAFIGKVGKDMFGEQLKTAVEEVGIDTRNLVMDEEVHTTLAFVHTYPDGDRDFSFYRNPGADMMLKKEEVDEDLIRGAKIFHFGTLSSTHEGVREATRYAIDVAKEAGCIVSFDPNLRPPLWKSLDEAKAEIEYGLSKCDILKISDNEVEFLFGTTDYDEGARHDISVQGGSLLLQNKLLLRSCRLHPLLPACFCPVRSDIRLCGCGCGRLHRSRSGHRYRSVRKRFPVYRPS